MPDSRRAVALDIWGVLMIQVASATLIFLSGLLLTRLLSPTEFGAYDYIDVWVEILMFFALLGFDRLLILKIAVYVTENKSNYVRGIIRLAYFVAGSLSVVIGIGFWSIAYFYFANQALGLDNVERLLRLSILPITVLLLVMRVLIKLNQVILQGFKQLIPAYLPDYILRPLLLMIIVVAYWYLRGLNAQEALYIHSLAATLSLALGLYLSRRLIPISLNIEPTNYLPQDWFKAAIPFTLISVFTLLNLRGGAAILGTVSNFEVSALYGVSIRLTAIVSLALAASSAVLAPRIAGLYSQGRHEDLQRLVTFSSRIICAVAVPMLLVLIFGGHLILRFFGEIYPSAYNALLILCVGQVVNIGTGVVGWIVMMAGHERTMALVLSISAAIHIVGIIILSPIYGVEGAALATALSNIFSNLALSVFSYRHLKINPTIFA